MGTAADDPQQLTSGPGDDAPAPASAPSAPAAAAPAPAANPTIVHPARRGGLAGIVDEFRDAIAGTEAPGQVYKDTEGNAYIKHPQLSHGQQWVKIAAEALHGAAAGAAVGQGPGGKMRAGLAGFEAQQKDKENLAKHDKDMSEEVRAQNLDHFNAVKLKHDTAAAEFDLARRKVQATQSDVTFSQGQLDREKQLGSADLGMYKDEADLANVAKLHPDFWKDVHDNNIVHVPEYDQDGNRKGIHVFLRTPGVGSQLAPLGTPIKVYVPGKTPNDPPTLVDQVPTIPMTHDQVDAYNNAAIAKQQQWSKDQSDRKLKDAEAAAKQSEVPRNTAEANRANAEAGKATAEKNKIEMEEQQSNDQLTDDVLDGNIIPERLAPLLAKKDGMQFLEALTARAKVRGVTIDTSKLQSYAKTYLDYTQGKTAGVLRNLNTAMQHMDELSKMNTVTSRIPTTKDYNAYQGKVTNASAEIANALAKPGTSATKDEIAKVEHVLTPTFNRGVAIAGQVQSMIDNYKSVRNQWLQAAPSEAYEAKMPDLSPEAQDIVRKFDPQDANVWWGVPVLDKPGGSVIGYSKDSGKTMVPRQGRTQ